MKKTLITTDCARFISFHLVQKLLKLMNKKLKIKDHGEPEESVARRCPNTNRIIKETKYKPQTNLNDGLLKTLEWYLNVR